ncbi:hypothetical protein ACQPYE_17715 [Actinosynnema sp. CA-299493]
MAWFALHPPQDVRVVSFFVTARLAGQNSRAAFVDNVLEQLHALVGGPIPAVTDTTRETRLLGMLDTAAHACRADGENLVLLVDGLDEDQGADACPGEDRSIAALLPMAPPAGMRVVVASRPNPPVPGDVPEHHPLRSPAVVHRLTASTAAWVARADMERELEHLLHGSATEQDLLGLLAAAGGGLTGDDLAELTGKTRQQVDDQLRTVGGRSFTRRDSRFRPRELPDVYLLGHEELHAGVLAAFGEDRLAGYRRRLHEWAEHYRAAGWPPGTSEYLLQGYHAMLVAGGEFDRAVALSTDPGRHQRMLHLSGGDAQALDELTTLLDVLADHDPPDLAALARLALHHSYLRQRNFDLPAELPALWVALGSPGRAVSLARSAGGRVVDDPLTKTAEALFAAGRPEHAHEVLDQAVVEALAQPFFVDRDSRLVSVMQTLAKAGEWDRLITVHRRAGGPAWAITALLEVAGEPAESGAHERARHLLRHIESLVDGRVPPAVDLAHTARVLALTGDHKRARKLAWRARDLAQDLDTAVERAYAAPAVARGLIAVGARRRARMHVRRMVFLVRARPNEHDSSTLENTVRALVEVGDLIGARIVIRNIADDYARSNCAMHVAVAYARRGEDRWALNVIALWIGPYDRHSTLADVALALALNGNSARARAIAYDLRDRRAHDFPNQGPTIIQATRVFCAIGDLDEAEATAWSLGEGRDVAEALTVVAGALIRRGETDRAESLLQHAEAAVLGLKTSHTEADGYAATAQALIATGDLTRARIITDRLPEAAQRARLLHAEVTAGVADPDTPARLIDLAEALKPPTAAARVLAWAAEAHTRSGDVAQARDLLDQAESLADDEGINPSNACGAIAVAWAHTGDTARAMSVVFKNETSGWESLYEALLAAGEHDLARALVLRVEKSAFTVTALQDRLWLRAITVRRLVEVGAAERALDVVADIEAFLRATPEPEPASATLGPLAEAVLVVRDSAEAEDLVARVVGRLRTNDQDDLLNQGMLASLLAEARTKWGDLAGAFELCAMPAEPFDRAIVLLQVAATALRDSDLTTASPLIAEALRLGEWSLVMEEVGAHLPDVVAAVATEVIALGRAGS